MRKDLGFLSLKHFHGLSKAMLSCSSQLHVKPYWARVSVTDGSSIWGPWHRLRGTTDHGIFLPQLIKKKSKQQTSLLMWAQQIERKKAEPETREGSERELQNFFFLPIRLPPSKYCKSVSQETTSIILSPRLRPPFKGLLVLRKDSFFVLF